MEKAREKPFYEKHRDIKPLDLIDVFLTGGANPHFHHQMEILCVSKGEIRTQINNAERVLKKGDICVADSFDIHSFEILKAGSEGHILIVSKSAIPDYCAATKNRVLKDNFLCGSTAFKPAEQLISMLEENREQSNLFKRGIAAAFMGIIQSSFSYIPFEKGEKSTLMRDILQYIHEHFADELTLEGIAKKFGYSPNHFSTIFNAFTGKGLKDYINGIRAEYAAEAISNGVPVTFAAMDAGFASLRTFYRTFSKEYGRPPNQIAKPPHN